MAETVKVVCRVRPFNNRELEIHQKSIENLPEWEKQPIRSVIDMNGKITAFLDHQHEYQEKERFSFDESFWSIPVEQQKGSNAFCSQAFVYTKIGTPTLQNCWDGFNTCIFAYGQTGAGKTFTMMGDDLNPGLIPRLCQDLFHTTDARTMEDTMTSSSEDDKVTEYIIEARFLEIYNEHVKDLLWQKATPEDQAQGYDKDNLKVRYFPGQGPQVVGLTAVRVTKWSEMVDLIRIGASNRTEAATKMNDHSSRSHAVFKITFSQITKLIPKKQFEKMQLLERFSHINLVDLAGSERLKKSGAEGIHLKEAAAINKSLTTLKQVIDALVEGKSRATIPYRESQLTWLLSENLGGNSKTFMIACVSPHADNAEETLNTCRYALRAQGITCHATVNDSDDLKKLSKLKDEMARVQEQIERGGGIEIQAELEAIRNEHELMKQKLEDAGVEAQRLQEALVQQKEKRYGQALLTSFKVLKEKKEEQKLHREASLMGRRLSHQKKHNMVTSNEVQHAEVERDILQKEADEILEDIESKQTDLSFWKDTSKQLEQLQNDLLITEEMLRLEGERKDGEKKLKAMVQALEQGRLKLMLDAKVKAFSDKHAATLEQASSSAARHYDEYANIAIIKQGELASEVDSLKLEVAEVRNRLEATRLNKNQKIMQLEKERVFAEQEKTNLHQAFQENLRRIVDENMQLYHLKKESLRRENKEEANNWQERSERELYQLRLNFEKKKMDWEAEVEDARIRGEHKLMEINRDWNTYYEEGCSELQNEVLLRDQNINEMKELLREYEEEKEPRFSDVFEKIEKQVQAVAAYNNVSGGCPFSMEVRSLVNALLYQASEYKSNVPSKYSLAPPSYDDAVKAATTRNSGGGSATFRGTKQAPPLSSVANRADHSSVRSSSPNSMMFIPREVHGADPHVTWKPRSSSPMVLGHNQSVRSPRDSAAMRSPQRRVLVVPAVKSQVVPSSSNNNNNNNNTVKRSVTPRLSGGQTSRSASPLPVAPPVPILNQKRKF